MPVIYPSVYHTVKTDRQDYYYSKQGYLIPITRAAMKIVVAGDSPEKYKSQADYVCDGVADDVDIQEAIDATIVAEGGTVILLGGSFALASALTIDQTNLTNPFRLSAYGCTLTYSGSGVALTVSGNVAGAAGYPKKRVILEGFNLVGTSSAAGGILLQATMRNVIRDIYIESFTAANAYGIKQYSIDSNQFTEQNAIYDSSVYSCYYPLYFDNRGLNRFDETIINNVRVTVEAGGTGFLLAAGSLGFGASTFSSLYIFLGGNDATGFDFGNHEWLGSCFINPVVENPSSYTGCTAFTSAGFSNPYLLNPYVYNEVATLWGGSSRNWYGTISYPQNDMFLANPSFDSASFLYTMKEGAGSRTGDISGNKSYTSFSSIPTWGSTGQLGNATLGGPTAESTDLSMDGDQTIILVVSPSWAWNDSTSHTFFKWTVDANNTIYLNKGTGNTIGLVAVGGGTTVVSWVTPLAWSSGDVVVFVATIDESAGTVKLYQNGQLLSTATDGVYSQSATEAVMDWAWNGSGAHAGGDYAFFAALPRLMGVSDMSAVSGWLAKTAGLDWVNSGTATVTNGNTSIVVNHGLSTTPTRVQITPRENPTNAVAFWWVDTLTATQFTINVNADPGASGLDIDWRAVVGEGN